MEWKENPYGVDFNRFVLQVRLQEIVDKRVLFIKDCGNSKKYPDLFVPIQEQNGTLLISPEIRAITELFNMVLFEIVNGNLKDEFVKKIV